MDGKSFLTYVVPIFILPILVHLFWSYLAKNPAYRLNDLVTNLSLSLLATLSGLFIVTTTYAAYAYVLQHHAILHFDKSSPATWVVPFFGYDLCYYWAHRAHHRVAILWASHVVHHSGEDCNFGLAIRQSVTGQLTFWIFFIPLALAGVPLEAYLSIAFVQLVYQYFIHNEFIGTLGWLEYILVTPSQHRIHHSRNEPYIDKNYGNVLVIWDRLFGTYAGELASEPPVYGLRKQVRSWNPWTINVHQYSALLQKVAKTTGFINKLKCLFLTPDWAPSLAASRLGNLDADLGLDKHDPIISRSARLYVLYQFTFGFISFAGFLWYFRELPPIALTAGAVFIITSSYFIGLVLDGKSVFWHWELGRQVAVLVAAAWLLVAGVLNGHLLYVIVVYAAISIILAAVVSRRHPKRHSQALQAT